MPPDMPRPASGVICIDANDELVEAAEDGEGGM